ncbi:MAG TPA: glutathione-disulfide reductase [Rhodanobacteraceae bacterium]|nr:glutathione-disulfide reductase [Rhodanobacteraceae bacterium]
MDERDLIVLGAGSGGIAVAIRAARHGARVTLLEPNAIGGTCVNVGCVPKKAMWLAAELAEAQALAREVGFASEPGALDWVEYVRRRQAYIDDIHASYRRRFTEFGIELVAEYGRFVDAKTIATGTRTLAAKHVVVATGAKPRRPSLPGGDLGIVSDGFFDLRAAPRRAAIVGGGYIAVELAGVLHALGADVTVFVRGDRLLAGFDAEATEQLKMAMIARGVQVAMGREPISATRHADAHTLQFADGEAIEGFDALVWAIGRDPNTEWLDLEKAGVRLGRGGFVETDEWQNTNVEGIHALGDVTGRLALTPVAVAAGRRLADRLFGNHPDAKLDYTNVPTVVFAHPPLASVGLSEEAARAVHGSDVAVYRVRFRPMFSALTGGDERTFMKLVCVGADERVVGIHVVGRAADEMLQGFAVALKAGARKCDFDATVAIHPTSSEELVLMGEMNRTPVV